MEHDDQLLPREKATDEGPRGPGEETAPRMEQFSLQELAGTAAATETATLDELGDVELDVWIDLGRAYMRFEDVLKLEPGAVVPLDKTVDEPVDVFAGGRLIARAEILVLDGHFAVRVTDLVAAPAAA